MIYRSNLDKYYVFLIVGMMPWNFFSESIGQGAGCVFAQGDMVKKIYFPREVLVISTVTSRFVNFLINYLVAFAIMILLCSFVLQMGENARMGLVDKYWDGEKWSIDPVEYDIDMPPITLYTPKIGKDAAIIEWATARAQQRQKVDEVFVRFLPWMLNKVPKDPQALDRMISKCMKEYKSWDADTFEFMDDVVRNITINPSERLRTVCPHCGGEATSNVQFPDGIKVLFKREGRAKKFGSR